MNSSLATVAVSSVLAERDCNSHGRVVFAPLTLWFFSWFRELSLSYRIDNVFTVQTFQSGENYKEEFKRVFLQMFFMIYWNILLAKKFNQWLNIAVRMSKLGEVMHISIDKGWHQNNPIRRNLLFCFGKFPPRLLVACTHSLYKAAPPLKLIMFINVPNSLFIPPSSITKHQFELFGHWLQPWLINLSFDNV